MKYSQLLIQRPIQIVIDDVGWRNGFDGSAQGQPFRSGAERLHDERDYEAIAMLGQALGVRPQAAMILSEWDCKNELAQIPSASWLGAKWDNSHNLGPWMKACAQVLRDQSEFIEVTMHGLGHEYWNGAHFSRAEWANEDGEMRASDEVEKRIKLFHALMDYHDLGPKPESFVPCAFCHGFGKGSDGIQGFLSAAGIKYVSTPFNMMKKYQEPQAAQIGIDQGVTVLDRGHYQVPWNAFDALDEQLSIPGPILGIHWTNLLHEDPGKNDQVIDKWVAHLKRLGTSHDVSLARNTQEAWTQFYYHSFYDVFEEESGLVLRAKSCAPQMIPGYLGHEIQVSTLNKQTGDWEEHTLSV